MASGFEVSGTDLDSILAPYHSGWPQAPATSFQVSGTDLNARYAPIVTGTATGPTGCLYRGADLNTIFAGFGTTGVIVLTQPGNVSGVAAAGNPSGTVTSNTTSCAGSKGKGTYTYTWHIASGSGAFTAPNSQTTAVTGTVNAGTTSTGTMYCTISDGTTSVNTNVVSYSLQNTTPAFTSAIYIYTSGSGTQAAPTGAINVTIEVWAGGGGGGFSTGPTAGGGGSGAYVESGYACSAGQTLNYSVGAGGAASTTPTAGGNSTVTAGTLAITTMLANGGGSGFPGTGGAPGGASGGNTLNTTGNAGGVPTAGAPIAGNVPGDGSPYGGGGIGGSGSSHPGSTGHAGAVVFYYT